MVPQSIDVAMLGIRIHTGDVATFGEMTIAIVVIPLVYALIGLTAHASFTKLSRSPASKAILIVAMAVITAGFPFAALSAYPVRSRLTAFVLSYHAVLGFFRWVEFVLGRGPKGSAASSFTFAAYFSYAAEILFEDGKVKRLSSRTAACTDLALRAGFHVLVFLVVNSIGRATGMLPYAQGHEYLTSLPLYGWPKTLPALYLQTCMVYCMMGLVMLLYRLVLAILRVDSLVAFKAPLVRSTSLPEFWGRRWNLIVHNLLKRCFFEPFRAGPVWQQHLGGFLAFLMSGLFHEYMWLALHAARPGSSKYVFGKVTTFFVVQFVATAAQAMMARSPLNRVAAMLPDPVLTCLVTLAVLPFSPLFLEGCFGMLREINDALPAVEVQDGGLGLKSLILCLLSVGPVAFLSRRSSLEHVQHPLKCDTRPSR